jgi:hypothetical protein
MPGPKTRTDGRPTSKYEDLLLENRSGIMLFLTAVVLFLLGLFLRVLLVGPWLGISPLEVIEGLLATGTFALAYAALVQAISAEKKRHADLQPHLDIRLLWPESSPQLYRSQPITYDIFP